MDAATLSSLLRQRLATSGSVTLRAGGFSMVPALLPGARLVVVALDAADPRPGRVYLFEHPGGPRAHRFVGADASGLHFRGDNARRAETVPDVRALIGRVDAVMVAGRRLALASPAGRALVAVATLGVEVTRALLPAALRHRLGGLLRRRLE